MSAVRAAKTQWSPARKLPLPPAATENETTIPSSSTTSVVACAGTVIRPLAPARSRSTRVVPAPLRTVPAWSQRRTRRCRAAACGGVGGLQVGGQRVVEADRARRVVDGHLAHRPRPPVELVAVVEHLDPVAGRDAQHVVLADRGEPEHGRRDHLDHRDRDRAVVARPLEGRRAGRAARRGPRPGRSGSRARGSRRWAAARTGRRRRRRRSSPVVSRPAGRRDQVEPAGDLVVVRRRSRRRRVRAAAGPARRSASGRSCRRRPPPRRGPGPPGG